MDADRQAPFWVRSAQPADIPALMRLKYLLAKDDNALHAVRASAADWLRDGFGPRAGFIAFVAVTSSGVIGMAICSERTLTGWNGPVIFLQDLIVEPGCRLHGVGSALIARVATLARNVGSPLVELTVRADNIAAQDFYRQKGFVELPPQYPTFVLTGPALAALADRDSEVLALAG
jgi:ribosomal protein S18 acetylase RimI-like enzyme